MKIELGDQFKNEWMSSTFWPKVFKKSVLLTGYDGSNMGNGTKQA